MDCLWRVIEKLDSHIVYCDTDSEKGLFDANDIEEFKNLVNNKYVDLVQEYIFMCDEDEKDFLQIGELKITVGEE